MRVLRGQGPQSSIEGSLHAHMTLASNFLPISILLPSPLSLPPSTPVLPLLHLVHCFELNKSSSSSFPSFSGGVCAQLGVRAVTELVLELVRHGLR